jgi:hypothetical protein
VRSKLIVASIVATAVGLVACEQLLGLDKFTEVEGGPDGGAEGGGDVASDAPQDVFQLPDGVSEASSWARWRMDNTALEVADGASEASLASFVTTDAGTIFDQVSGKLLWNTATNNNIATFAAATAYCSSLGGAWRLPTRIELVTLLDTTRPTSPYVSPAFSSVKALLYYTSSYARPVTGTITYWYVDFIGGDVITSIDTFGGVICVQSL